MTETELQLQIADWEGFTQRPPTMPKVDQIQLQTADWEGFGMQTLPSISGVKKLGFEKANSEALTNDQNENVLNENSSFVLALQED